MPSKWVKLPTVNASLRMHSNPSRAEHGPYMLECWHAIKNKVRTQLLTVNASASVPPTPSRAEHARANYQQESTRTEILAPGIMQMYYYERIQFPLGVECAPKECLSYTRIQTNGLWRQKSWWRVLQASFCTYERSACDVMDCRQQINWCVCHADAIAHSINPRRSVKVPLQRGTDLLFLLFRLIILN